MTLLPMPDYNPEAPWLGGQGSPIGWTDFPTQQPQTPQGGFVWGQGGARLAPEQLQRQQMAAQQAMRPDFSPVEGGVLGALSRAAGNIYGAVQSKQLGKQEAAANADAQAQILAALGKDADLAPLLTSGDKVAQALGQFQLEQRNPKAPALSEFDKAIAGAGIDPRSPQGIALYSQRANTMAQPAPQFVSDGMGGGRWVTPPATPMQGGGDPNLAGTGNAGPQPGTIEDGYRFKGGNPADPSAWELVQGGPMPPASGGFRPGG